MNLHVIVIALLHQILNQEPIIRSKQLLIRNHELYQTTFVVYVIFTAIFHCHDITLKNSFTDRQFSMQTKLLA